ncbi:MAG: hypothetical protein ACLP52_03575 [Streptosporangiaceae bacterium]
MSTTLIIALIALGGSILSTIITVLGAPTMQARRDARKDLESYREPLLAAAYELQARLYNILKLGFVDKYISGNIAGKRNSAIESTLYVFAQYFGWREIIRREVQYLRFGKNQRTREIGRLLQDIGETFLADQFGPQFMIWRLEQRGLGERMIVSADGRLTCLGYASFIDQRASMQEWLQPIEHDFEHLQDGGRERLMRLQHLLLEMVWQLDDKQKRYPAEMSKC